MVIKRGCKTLALWLVVMCVMGWAENINSQAAQPHAGKEAAQHAPIIGISGSGERSESVRHIMQSLTRRGAHPILLDVTRIDQLPEALKHVHAVVIAGNSLDINPEDYGAQPHHKTRNEDENKHTRSAIERERDNYEYALIDEVLKTKLPFLGICSGMQRLNVHNHAEGGGTLSQHVDGQNQLALETPVSVHEGFENMYVKPHTRLASLLAPEKPRVVFAENSVHHQHVETVRKGFRPVAYNWEGIVEAIEPEPNGPYADYPFLFGVQWHPEYGASEQSNRLMDGLVEAARIRAKETPVRLQDAKRFDTTTHALREAIGRGLPPAYDDMGKAR